MVSIIWTAEALQDIDNIAAFISMDSEFYAKQFVQRLFAAVVKLERYPEAGKPLPELPQSPYREIFLRNTGLFIALILFMYIMYISLVYTTPPDCSKITILSAMILMNRF